MKARSKTLLLVSLFFIILGIINGTSIESLKHLITTSDALVADYFQIAGKGTTFLNVGLMMLGSTFLLWFLDIELTGVVVSSIFLLGAFSFFGKNPINATPIILGGLLYTKYHKEDIQKTIPFILTSTGFAPFVSELMFHINIGSFQRLILSIIAGLSIGWIIIPLTLHLKTMHKGLTLYGVGFALGFTSIIYVSFLKLFGYQAHSVSHWSSDTINPKIVLLFLTFIFLVSLYKERSLKGLIQLTRQDTIKDVDYINIYSIYTSLMNMSLNGILTLIYLQFINAPLNGPTLGAFLAVVGFGAYGKNIRTISSIYLGVLLGQYLGFWQANSPAMIFAAMFGTALSPITVKFGFFIGIIASFMNAFISIQLGSLHAGLNLYNTGFASGIVATFFSAFLSILPLPKQKNL